MGLAAGMRPDDCRSGEPVGLICVGYHQRMNKDESRVTVVGAGYVGLATAVVLAEQGHHVVLVERDPDRLAALANRQSSFHCKKGVAPGPCAS
jgi:NADPH-dependent 2,4-dienoyl-CoA reductase/sulfur reductase-like enzyme